jgi:hypothetical protein
MKKQNILLPLLFTLIIALAPFKNVFAWVLAPYFDLNINIETDGRDGTFLFKLFSYISGGGGETQNETFSVTTASSSAQYLHSVEIEDNTPVILKYIDDPQWKMNSWQCTSDNPEITFTSDEPNIIKMSGRAYNTVDCKLNYKKNSKNPVIIIPGILSSYLNRNDDDKTELWPNLKKIILNLGRDKFLDELSLNQIGQINFSYPLALPTDIIRSLGGKDFFAGLISELESVGYVENENIFVFPYDWRLDIRSSVDDLPSEILVTLKEKIDNVLAQTSSEKVDIIAHSMGGLLVKQYILEYGSEEKIEKFVDIGTPHLGAPNAFKTLFAGDNLGIKFGFLGLNTLEVKKIIRNMPSAYQLLPNENYLDDDLPDYRYFVYDMVDYDNDGVRGRLNLEQSNNFLKNSGVNNILLDIAPHVHDDLDSLVIDSAKIKTFNLVGCGTPTVGKIFVTGRDRKGPIFDLAYISGDGTVPERSARSFTADNEYQFSGLIHAEMSSHPKVRNVVSSILLEDNLEIIDDSNCEIADSNLYSVRGPVKIEVPEGEVYPLYDEIFDNTFFVTSADNHEPVIISASDTGKFSAKVKKMRGGRVVSTINFNNVQIPSATSTFNISGQSSGNFFVTVLDDGNQNAIYPDSNFEGDSLEDLIPPETTVEVISGATSSKIIFNPDNEDSTVYFATTTSISTEVISFSTGTSTVIVSPGVVYIYYYSIDQAGNVEEKKFEEVFVDYKAPPEADDNPTDPPIVVIEKEEKKSGASRTGGRNINVKKIDSENIQEVNEAEIIRSGEDGALVEVEENNKLSKNEQTPTEKEVVVEIVKDNESGSVPDSQLAAVVMATVKQPSAVMGKSLWGLLLILLLLILLFALEQNFRKE